MTSQNQVKLAKTIPKVISPKIENEILYFIKVSMKRYALILPKNFDASKSLIKSLIDP